MTKRSLLLVCALSLILLPLPWNSAPASASLGDGPTLSKANRGKDLTIHERIAYQRRIEEVYWRHRTWPKENPEPKLPLDEVMPLAAIRAKTDDYLRKSAALEMYWGRRITGDQLQAEMDRMASQTKSPGLLKE